MGRRGRRGDEASADHVGAIGLAVDELHGGAEIDVANPAVVFEFVWPVRSASVFDQPTGAR